MCHTGHIVKGASASALLFLIYLATDFPTLIITDLSLPCVLRLVTQVVVTNQMTTMVSGGGSSQQVPALGESWAHVPTQRVILYWQDHQRHAVLYKSASAQQTDVRFQITVSEQKITLSLKSHSSVHPRSQFLSCDE